MTMQQQEEMFLGSRYLREATPIERFDYEQDLRDAERIERQYQARLREMDERQRREIRALSNEFFSALQEKRNEFYRQREIEAYERDRNRRDKDMERMRRIARRADLW